MSNPPPYPQVPKSEPPPAAPHANHGGTPAAWALIFIAGVGVVVGAVGVAMRSSAVILAGAIIVALGIVASIVLKAMGKGQPDLPVAKPRDEDLAHLYSDPPRTAAQQEAEAETAETQRTVMQAAREQYREEYGEEPASGGAEAGVEGSAASQGKAASGKSESSS
ncbi:MAG TPA: HGxxPAAW family protein [Beutenbergiaceae bacterium]|nr:HGxxPAAW family protein [Beutenbergiaceae bacterium]